MHLNACVIGKYWFPVCIEFTRIIIMDKVGLFYTKKIALAEIYVHVSIALCTKILCDSEH